MKVRHPSQAGTFYAGSAATLRSEVESCFKHKYGPGRTPKVKKDKPRKIVGLVVPHAGYMYSGHIAAHSYLTLGSDGTPKTVVLLGPNHTGLGSGISISTEGAWRTPLGDVAIDSDVANQIWRTSEIIDVDEEAHRFEHSIEVQLPFLQYLYGCSFKFVPICFMMQDLETCKEVGKAIGSIGKDHSPVVIASTDLTHYESSQVAQQKDSMVIEAIIDLDEDRLYEAVISQNISMCGYGPVISAIVAAKELGSEAARLLSYGTSGDISGDRDAVVGYASLSFEI